MVTAFPLSDEHELIAVHYSGKAEAKDHDKASHWRQRHVRQKDDEHE
jgi:hypothetical protein